MASSAAPSLRAAIPRQQDWNSGSAPAPPPCGHLTRALQRPRHWSPQQWLLGSDIEAVLRGAQFSKIVAIVFCGLETWVL
jgi:hypothetical protein